MSVVSIKIGRFMEEIWDIKILIIFNKYIKILQKCKVVKNASYLN